MLLVLSKQRLDVRSAEEMTIDELWVLRVTLETSEAVRRYVSTHRPRRGGRVFGLVPLLLLYLYMECRKTKYHGVIRDLREHDCVRLGLVDEKCPRRPSYATLNAFVNRVLGPMAEAIGDELAAAVLQSMSQWTYTLDSAQLQASRYNKDAGYSAHYEIRMDKAHNPMADGYPLVMMQSGEFLARMEDVLETYALPYDEAVPMVCMDEHPVPLLDHSRAPISIEPGRERREDHGYERRDTCNVFMFTEPLAGWRYADVSERRTKKDWAHRIKELLGEHYPNAERIRLVMDNLNTHSVSSLYEMFEPEEALRLAQRLNIHHTPKHGSWLNIAEIELSAMIVQCLDRRMPDMDSLRSELNAWERERNASCRTVDWHFSTDDARNKLRWLYPKLR